MPGDTAERLRRLQERRARTGSPTPARPHHPSTPRAVAPWPPPGVVVRIPPTGVPDAAIRGQDRSRRRRKQPALITRALIAVASIGTFVMLVTAMGPVRDANGPSSVNDATDTSTTSATTVLTVGDIGQMSASLHHGSTPVSPSTTGR